jgi:glycosyltransferase involved in cell wall biosynthesis
MKLSILIPSLIERSDTCGDLCENIHRQLAMQPYRYEVEIVKDLRPKNEATIGQKRNSLLQRAAGDYVCFVDDDDSLAPNYLQHIFEGIARKVDCCSLKGIITTDGKNPLVFEHSIKYSAYKTNPDGSAIKYERYPNHLNTIKTSIAKQFKFPEINHGEDTDWATQLFKSGLIKTEHYIDDIIYYYLYKSVK